MIHMRGLRILTLLFLIVGAACSPDTTGEEFETFDPGQFSQPTRIDNEWFPLPPGAQLTFEGFTSSQGEKLTHRVIFTVTDLVKEIAGIQNVVAWERDYSEDELVEAELVFFAQADDGTVWSLGQYPEEYDQGKIIESPAWIHGIEEAVAGISMLGDPQPATESYSQGWGPAVEYTDRGMVSKEGQQICVPFDCFEDVLVIDETSLLEPDAHQLKFYASGVGNIKVDWTGEDQTQETLELTGFTMLDAAAMAKVQSEALKLEASAYANSPDVYGKTSPSVPAAPTTGGMQPVGETGEFGEIVVNMSDLAKSALTELEFMDDESSPGGKYVSLPNNGDELDPPPENDPHVTFTVPVVSDKDYRCWVHLKVGAPLGKSMANVVWLQFTDAVDVAGNAAYQPGSNSYLTAQGPASEGWTWVGCDLQGGAEGTLINFSTSGEVTVRIQAGAEGVGFDKFVLSPDKYLESAPNEISSANMDRLL